MFHQRQDRARTLALQPHRAPALAVLLMLLTWQMRTLVSDPRSGLALSAPSKGDALRLVSAICLCRGSQGPLNGGVSNGGASRSGLVLPFLSFFVLSRFFWDFPDLVGDGPGIFPIGSVPLSRPIKSTNEEQSRKGPRHNLDRSRKKWETPRFGNTPV